MRVRSYLTESLLTESMPDGTVQSFLTVLSSLLTQFDSKQSGKRGYNPHALGIYMGALGDLRHDVSSVAHLDTPEAMAKLKKAAGRKFSENFPPLVKLMKKIDAWLAHQEKPSII